MANFIDKSLALQTARKRAAELPETNYIISLDNPKQRTQAGHVFVAGAIQTAICGYDMNHRLCTKEEVQTYLGREDKLRQSLLVRESARRQNFNVNVTVPART